MRERHLPRPLAGADAEQVPNGRRGIRGDEKGPGAVTRDTNGDGGGARRLSDAAFAADEPVAGERRNWFSRLGKIDSVPLSAGRGEPENGSEPHECSSPSNDASIPVTV
jgi:hypothetical protein